MWKISWQLEDANSSMELSMKCMKAVEFLYRVQTYSIYAKNLKEWEYGVKQVTIVMDS